MPWEVKSFPVKGCCRTYTRLGWHCYSALVSLMSENWGSPLISMLFRLFIFSKRTVPIFLFKVSMSTAMLLIWSLSASTCDPMVSTLVLSAFSSTFSSTAAIRHSYLDRNSWQCSSVCASFWTAWTASNSQLEQYQCKSCLFVSTA